MKSNTLLNRFISSAFLEKLFQENTLVNCQKFFLSGPSSLPLDRDTVDLVLSTLPSLRSIHISRYTSPLYSTLPKEYTYIQVYQSSLLYPISGVYIYPGILVLSTLPYLRSIHISRYTCPFYSILSQEYTYIQVYQSSLLYPP